MTKGMGLRPMVDKKNKRPFGATPAAVVRRNYDKALPAEDNYAVPSNHCLSSREYLQADTL
jgi:hypothetical protein